MIAAAVAAATLVGAGCGGEEASVVQTAFETPVESAQVALRLDVDQGGRSLMRMTMNGPMKANGKGKLESFDWRVRVSAQGRTVMAGRVISSGDNVFVRYGGKTYEVGEERVAGLNRQSAGGDELGLRDLTRMGIDLQKWFPDTGGEPQDSEVDGVATRKVTGRLDVSVALRQLAAAFKRPELREQMGGQVPKLSAREIRMIDALVTDPRFELEAGRDDGKLRRIAARLRFDDPRGAGNGAMRFELRLRDVDAPVEIEAPASGRPIEELLRKLGVPGGGRRDLQPA